MKITLELDIQLKDDVMILKSRSGKAIMFAKEHAVQRKVQMVALAELSDLTIDQICRLFNYKTRKSYYDVKRSVLGNDIEALSPKKTGPKTAPKRTFELEKRVIQLRLTTDKNMYDITSTVNQEGFAAKPRLVSQILADFGITKKKYRKKK